MNDPLYKGQNALINCFSSAVNVVQNEEKGRHITAACSIPAGSLLARELPYAAVVEPAFLHLICDQCLEVITADKVKCVECDSDKIAYCSGQCLRDAKKQHHNWECGFSEMYELNSVAFRLAFRIIIRTPIESVLDWHNNNVIDVQRALTETIQRAIDFQSIMNLLPVPYNEKQYIRYRKLSVLAVDFLNCRQFFECEPASAESEWLVMNKLQKIEMYESVFLNVMLRISRNRQGIDTNPFLSDNQSIQELSIDQDLLKSSGLYAYSALLNHSCTPNVFASYHRFVSLGLINNGSMEFRAIEAIPAGDEICQSYGPLLGSMSRLERQTKLQKAYFFECQCRGCTDQAYEAIEAQQFASDIDKSSYKSESVYRDLARKVRSEPENDEHFIKSEAEFKFLCAMLNPLTDRYNAICEIRLKTAQTTGSITVQYESLQLMCKSIGQTRGKTSLQYANVLRQLASLASHQHHTEQSVFYMVHWIRIYARHFGWHTVQKLCSTPSFLQLISALRKAEQDENAIM